MMDEKDIKPWETGKKKDKDPDLIRVHVPGGEHSTFFKVNKESLGKILNILMEEESKSMEGTETLMDIKLTISNFEDHFRRGRG